jgi:hypothetical protein
MTNWAKGGGASDDLARAALGAFVGALGGASKAAAGAAGGVRTAGGLGEFLADVSRDGLDTTLEAYGLEDLVGGEPVEVMNELAARIAGAGDSPEEAVARDALLDVLGELFEGADTFVDMDVLVIDDAMLREFVARYLTEYIFLRVLHEIGDRITDNAAPAEAERLERELGDQIRALVDLDLSTIDSVDFDWQGAAGQARLQELLADAFRMVSAGE